MTIWSVHRSRWLLLPLTLCLCANASPAEDPTVYFFTGGSLATTGLPGSKHGQFGGSIFDGRQRIGSVWRNHYLAVFLAPGTHEFSASLSDKHPAENSRSSLFLEADRTYFLRVQSESKGVLIVESFRGRIEEVPCATAHEDAEKAKPVEEKHVSPELRGHVVPGKTFPACP